MDTRNTGYFLLNRISNKERQYRDECLDKTRRSDDVERKKDIFERTIFRTSKDLRILFSTKYRLSN